MPRPLLGRMTVVASFSWSITVAAPPLLASSGLAPLPELLQELRPRGLVTSISQKSIARLVIWAHASRGRTGEDWRRGLLLQSTASIYELAVGRRVVARPVAAGGVVRPEVPAITVFVLHALHPA